ncbi:hypothetical protein AgCh_000301 [Apium graveolens]
MEESLDGSKTWNSRFEEFKDVVDNIGVADIRGFEAWSITSSGDPWFCLKSEIKNVKVALKSLNLRIGYLPSKVKETRQALVDFQNTMSVPPTSMQCSTEISLKFEYVKALNPEEDDSGAVLQQYRDINCCFVEYFKSLFDLETTVQPIPNDLDLPMLSEIQKNLLQCSFYEVDVLATLKTMGKGKSPGPDGFSPEFFLSTWSITGKDFSRAIPHFFEKIHMPRQVNSTAIALIPKVANPFRVTDFRPISCCNVAFKCISKILSSRYKSFGQLKLVISDGSFTDVGFPSEFFNWLAACIKWEPFHTILEESGFQRGELPHISQSAT